MKSTFSPASNQIVTSTTGGAGARLENYFGDSEAVRRATSFRDSEAWRCGGGGWLVGHNGGVMMGS